MGQGMVDRVGQLLAPVIIGTLVVGAGRKDGWDGEALVGFSRPHDFGFDEVRLPVKVGIEVGFNVDDFANEAGRVKACDGLTVKSQGFFSGRQLVGPSQGPLGRQLVQVAVPVLGSADQQGIEGSDHGFSGPLGRAGQGEVDFGNGRTRRFDLIINVSFKAQ